MADVRPLPPGPARLVTPPPPRSPAARAPQPAAAAGPDRGDGAPLTALERAGDGFAFVAAGIDRRQLRALESGARPPEGTLDLHGRKSHEAESSLEAFVRGALSGGRRIVLIVHGRGLGSGEGGPVLRTLVHARLTSGPLARAVLALVAAPPRWGGTGAALVWLRRGP